MTIPTRAAMAIANGTAYGQACLPCTSGKGTRLAPALGELVLGTTRSSAYVASVVHALIVAQAETDGSTVVPVLGSSRPSRAGDEALTPTPAELRLATPGLRQLVKTGTVAFVRHHRPKALRARGKLSATSDTPTTLLRVLAIRAWSLALLAPVRAVAVGNAQPIVRRIANGLVALVPIP